MEGKPDRIVTLAMRDGTTDKCHCSEALNVFQSKLLPYMSSSPCINLINLPMLMDTISTPCCLHTHGSFRCCVSPWSTT